MKNVEENFLYIKHFYLVATRDESFNGSFAQPPVAIVNCSNSNGQRILL